MFKDKVKISVFVKPSVARAMKIQAARLGASGISELVTWMMTKPMKDIEALQHSARDTK